MSDQDDSEVPANTQAMHGAVASRAEHVEQGETTMQVTAADAEPLAADQQQ
jgi:hypothetical protein